MAASLVGGAFLSSFINVLFNRLSDPMIINMMRGKKVDRKLLQKLETILNVVEAVLNDAEKKQITDPAVKRWLENLQDVVYDADDLLYEFVTKAATQKDPGNSLPPSLRWLCIKNCKNLEFPMQHQQHFSLEYLHIDNSCDSLTSFALLVFPNLKNLKITRLKNLTSLGDVSQSQSLRELSILGCPKLEKIRLPASLRELRISECQLLVEGIERKDPHIWSTISHIPHIEVDGFRFHDDSAS